jgi:hypothetical protein
LNIENVDSPLRSLQSAEGVFGIWMQHTVTTSLGIRRWHVVQRDCPETIVLIDVQNTKPGVAYSDRILQDRLEDGF